MLPRRQRFERPLPVEAVDERDVNGIDLTVLQHCVIAREDFRNLEVRGHFLGALPLPAGDGDQPPVARGADGGDDRLARDPRGAKHSPTEALPIYMCVSRRIPPCAIDSVAASMTATVRRASCGATASRSSCTPPPAGRETVR